MDTKTCCGCEQDLPIDRFTKRKDRKDGLRSRCKDCTAQQMREWYAKDPGNRERHKQLVKVNKERYKTEKREYLYEYLMGNPCVDCGESDPVVLDFDHIDCSEKSFQISNAIDRGLSLKKIQAEIEKCQVRCSNCHRKRTASQFSWWKTSIKN